MEWTREDLPDTSDALKKWFTVWRKTVPCLGLLCGTIQQDTTYSVPGFLTLYTRSRRLPEEHKDRDRELESSNVCAARGDISRVGGSNQGLPCSGWGFLAITMLIWA
jgi:hypothetical protein